MNEKKLTIILPGKIGDIIICLPIAKFYADKGYKIIWPIYDFIISNFDKGHFPYINFKPVPFFTSIPDSFRIANEEESEVLDLSFTNHGCWDNENSKKFLSQKEMSFDRFRYSLAKVPFEEKWNLNIVRNVNREHQLYNYLINNDKYIVYQDRGSDKKINIKLDMNNLNYEKVEIKPRTDCIFDWIKILIDSKSLILIDSCFANLVEQLNLKNKKYFIKRSPELCTPILKNEWVIV